MKIGVPEIEKVFNIRVATATALLEKLSPREREVAGLMANGLSNARIASRLDISPKTLDIHRANICKKFGGIRAIGIPRIVLCAAFAEG